MKLFLLLYQRKNLLQSNFKQMLHKNLFQKNQLIPPCNNPAKALLCLSKLFTPSFTVLLNHEFTVNHHHQRCFYACSNELNCNQSRLHHENAL